jgi:hypothetical protein
LEDVTICSKNGLTSSPNDDRSDDDDDDEGDKINEDK